MLGNTNVIKFNWKNNFRKFYWCFETPHKKKEVARNTEIECQKEIQIEKIKQSGGSFKDELILAWFLIIMSLPLIGETERFLNWAKVLSAMPSEIFYILVQ